MIAIVKIKEAFRTVTGTLFRLLPLSVEPGIRTFGRPDENSPVFVTANFHLTLKRVAKHLKNLNCYLLVAPTGGINVWCAARGGNFTAHSIISVVKTSGINNKVTNRTLIIPQLAAPGIDTGLIKRETGWRCKFGPVYAADIPEYIANGFKKTDTMHQVNWDFINRLDIGIGISFPIFLLILIIMAIFFRAWIFEFIILGCGLFLLMYGLYPIIPGKAGWHKLLFLEALIAIGLVGYTALASAQSDYVYKVSFMAMGVVLAIGTDYGGVTPIYKSDLDPLLDKLGIARIGPVNMKGRSKILSGKILLDQAKCTSCGICYDVCPRGVYAIENNKNRKAIINSPELCVACEACVFQCPTGAITFGMESLPGQTT